MRIITENQYKLAQKRVEDLLPLVDDSTPLDDPKAVELMMMSDIVIDYESEHFPIAKPSVAELIADGLKENHITQKQLAEELGISTTRANDFVSGKIRTESENSRTHLPFSEDTSRRDADALIGIRMF